MKKPEVYKQYDAIFNNKKIKYLKKELKAVNQKISKLDVIHEDRIKMFVKYCGVFIDKDICMVDKELRISKEKGIEHIEFWNKSWTSASNNYHNQKYIEQCLPLLSDEGKQVYETIKKLDIDFNIPRQMFNIGKIKKYHKEYFSLPSYVNGRNGYPINIILKKTWRNMGISIPAFHRYAILSEYNYGWDAQSLKRQMLLIEFYDDIKKHIIPILKEQNKKLIAIQKESDKIIEDLAKYELLTKI